MKSFLFLLNDAPCGDERVQNGLRLAGELADCTAEADQVLVF